MVKCPYCGGEVDFDILIKLFSCKYKLEEETIQELNTVLGEPTITVRHTHQCFPFGVIYNTKTGLFRTVK